jgi:hypothetical protein
VTRTSFRPGVGYRPRAQANERRSPPDRRAWLNMIERAAAAVDRPNDRHLEFAASLKGLKADNFPLPVNDVRRKWGGHFVEQARLWIDGGASTRTVFGPLIAVGAKALNDILIEAGADEATAARQRMGLGD